MRLIDLGDRSAEVLYNAGLMYERSGQADKAVKLYRDALEQQPDMAEALLNLGRILEAAGKSDEARTCWSKALAASPTWRKAISDRRSISWRKLNGQAKACPAYLARGAAIKR